MLGGFQETLATWLRVERQLPKAQRRTARRLQAEPARAACWAARLDELLPPGLRRVGLVWAGRATHNNDHRRSAALADLHPLFEAAGIALVALQKGGRQAETARYFGAAPLVNLGPELVEWADTAAVLAGLDTIVSVDTAVAHLAGALGRRVHLLLPRAAEWRWLLGREDTPWYPTMRLHRQTVDGQWDAPASSVPSVFAAIGGLPREVFRPAPSPY